MASALQYSANPEILSTAWVTTRLIGFPATPLLLSECHYHVNDGWREGRNRGMKTMFMTAVLPYKAEI